MKIVAFGATTSKNGINPVLAKYVAEQFASELPNSEVEVLDLNNYPLPLFSVDYEKEHGHPAIINDFLSKIQEADLLVISLAEHNGSYSVAFKNLFDWTSRIQIKLFEGKKIVLASASPGPGGGLCVLDAASSRFPKHGAEIVGQLSVPNFAQNFNPVDGLVNKEIYQKMSDLIEEYSSKVCQQTI